MQYKIIYQFPGCPIGEFVSESKEHDWLKNAKILSVEPYEPRPAITWAQALGLLSIADK